MCSEDALNEEKEQLKSYRRSAEKEIQVLGEESSDELHKYASLKRRYESLRDRPMIQGPKGDDGPTGPQGVQGPMGPVGEHSSLPFQMGSRQVTNVLSSPSPFVASKFLIICNLPRNRLDSQNMHFSFIESEILSQRCGMTLSLIF